MDQQYTWLFLYVFVAVGWFHIGKLTLRVLVMTVDALGHFETG